MANRLEFEVKITGIREGHPLRPELFDVDEWIGLMQSSRDLLYPEGRHPRLSVRMEAGSIRLILSAEPGAVIQTQALLEELKRTRSFNLLQPKQRDAVRYFQRLANDYKFVVQIGDREKTDQGLLIDHKTDEAWIKEEPVWVDAELYITGKITNIGGKTNPNIHLDTSDYQLGSLIISAPQALLAGDDKNRLYKEQQVRIRILQNVETGEFDLKSAELIEFISFEETGETPDEYLDRLIQQASRSWSKVEDPEQWLKEIRGYED